MCTFGVLGLLCEAPAAPKPLAVTAFGQIPHLAKVNWPHLAILIWPNLANFC